MLDLNDLFYFVRVVDQGGFTAAGRILNVPKSTLSYRIQMLEQSLEARLINRTSRRFALTDVGGDFYRHSVAMLEHAVQAEISVKKRLGEPAGSVRVTTSTAMAQFAMAGMIVEFVKRHPKVNVVEHVTDRIVDVVGENFDLAIRAHFGPLPDSTLIRRVLAPSPWWLFASPGYLAHRGTPSVPDDLTAHSSMFLTRGPVIPEWSLRDLAGGATPGRVVPIAPSLISDDMVTLKAAATAAVGIVALPEYVCRSELQSGKLAKVLPGWSAGEATISALVPHRLGSMPAVRALIDHLVTELPKALLP